MQDEIILYSTGCPRCDVLKHKLSEQSIDYTENNAIEDMKKMGIVQVPVLSINGVLYEFKSAVEWVNKHGKDDVL